MSHLLTPYILALLFYQKITSISQMSRFLGTISHDRLTDLLDGEWDGQTLLNSFTIRLLNRIGGYLIIDDTVISKPHSKLLESFGYIWDHSQKKAVYGIGLVLLVWTNGTIRLPIAFKIYSKGGTKRSELALQLLSYARNRLKLRRIKGVLFDSWYSSKKLLKRITDYGWHFYTQVKKNRCFNGIQLRYYRYDGYWHETGTLNGRIKVLLIRHRKKYYITSNMTINWQEAYNLYRFRRQCIEEVIKILKSQLCLSFLGDKKKHHWNHHIALTLSAFVVLEKFSKENKLTPYRMKEELICRRGRYEKALRKYIVACA